MHSAETDATAWSGIQLLARAFAAKWSNWLVLARNLIPVAGVYLLGWSANLTVFSYWLDGVSLLALLVLTVVRSVAADQRKRDPPPSVAKIAVNSAMGWIIVFGMFGIPYWMVFGALQMQAAVHDVLQDAGRTTAFAAIVVGNAWTSLNDGLIKLNDAQFKRRTQSALHTLVTRAFLMMLMTAWGFGLLLVPVMAVVLTATEVWPAVLAEVIRINSTERTDRA